MKLKRVFFALTLLPLALEVACSSDDKPKTIYIVPEGGVTVNEDGGTCEPANVPEAKFEASPINQKVCTDEDIIAVLKLCAFENASSQGCDEAKAQLGDCAKCMIGSEADPNSHPGYQYSADTVLLASPSACMLAVAKDDQQKKCAQAYGQIETCSLASCLPPCLDSSKDKFESCLTGALNTVCTKGTDVYLSDVCQQQYEGSTFGFCTSYKALDGTDLTDKQYFFAVARLICGGLESDAGATDSGTDANDIKDAASDG